jgi:hypothetical protein
MRFTQIPVPFACGTINVNKGDGGWQGAGGAPCSGFAGGDPVVRFDPDAANQLVTWMDGSSNYPGTPPPGKDFELRGSGNTPLGGALQSASRFIAGARAADCPQVAACRPYRVLLVTDGGETCGGSPAVQAAALFASADADGTVPVDVIGFSTPDPSVQMQLDQIAVAGGTGSFIPADDDVQVSAAIQAIVQSTILTELCNGVDDDCDGATDEDFPGLGAPCENGLSGACKTTGTVVCKADGSGTFCTAPAVSFGAEICNGIDDDCDGLIDEPPLGAPIGNDCGGTGACPAGHLACVGGAIICDSAPGGGAEICNGVDDDCDGFIDEPTLPEVGDACVPAGETNTFPPCQWEKRCVATGPAAAEIECVQLVGPSPEVCDGKDNDCDGVADNQATCPSPADLCHQGHCVAPCGMGEFPCPFDHYCATLPEGDFCLPDPCAGVTCNADERCDQATGTCVSLCAGVTCSANQSCKNGFCVDCHLVGCPEGERCADGMGGAACEPDPCYMNDCNPATEFCREGDCLPLACDPPCEGGQVCDMGECVFDLCQGVTCPTGQRCDPATGDCSADPCVGVSCVPGMVCNPGNGQCIADPCLDFACGVGQACAVNANGMPVCRDLPGYDVYATGSGGCAVGALGLSGSSTGAGQGTAAASLLLAALALLRRRSARAARRTRRDRSSGT